MQQSGTLGGQFNTKSSGFSNYLGVAGSNRPLMNPYFMNPLMDPSMLSAALLAAGLSGNMLESLTAVNYLNQMGYQDIIRQYQNNLSSISNLAASGYGSVPTSITGTGTSSVPTSSSSGIAGGPAGSHGSMPAAMGNLGGLTVQQLLNMSNAASTATTRAAPLYHQSVPKATTTTSSTKEAPSVSITPVGSAVQQHKSKTSKHATSHGEAISSHITKSMPIAQTSAKPAGHPPATQVSLLKPSIVQQTKTVPPKQMSAPQIRTPKTLADPQPAHNSSVSHSSLSTGNPGSSAGSLPQTTHTAHQGPALSIKPSSSMGMPPSRGGGTSLQHKLLSKKMGQQPQPVQPPKLQSSPTTKKPKTKVGIPQLPNNLQSLLNTMSSAGGIGQTPFIPPELSGISVSAVGQSVQKPPPPPKHPPFRKTSGKSKSASIEMPAMQAPIASSNTAETLSMLSQLQQHSHLEIIPQQKSHGKTGQAEYSKNMPVSLSVVPPQKVTDSVRSANAECMSVYDMPSRAKSSGNTSKKQDNKHAKESVEIITLDD